MTCHELHEYFDAYLDKELDLLTSSRFERHLLECPECRSAYEQYERLHHSATKAIKYFKAPADLETRIRTSLGLDALAAAPERKKLPLWRDWAPVAAAVIAILLLTALFLALWRHPSATDLLAQEVVSSHVRSLLANHLNDVASSDQHTVKPWFSGKLDFAPQVKDLSGEGFPLVGGRLDYLDNRPIAALVYRRGNHTINLFTWPSPRADAGPRTFTIRGYHLLHWTRAHMTYWAISDVNAADLETFARDLER